MKQHYHTIYLSPHPDDAVFSAGATIARHVAKGESVLVVTVCTASPRRGMVGGFAGSLHRRWRLSDADVVATRLAENTNALAELGADSVCLDFLDAIYRRPEAYNCPEQSFLAVAADDPLTEELHGELERLCRRYSDAWLCAPLAVARHVDHQATHLAAPRLQQRGRRVTFYEDLPYALEPGAVDRQLRQLGVFSLAIPFSEDVEPFLGRKTIATQWRTRGSSQAEMARSSERGVYPNLVRPPLRAGQQPRGGYAMVGVLRPAQQPA